MPTAALNEVFAVVTLIIQIQSGRPVGTASGFFYQKEDKIYLVTNRHVVLDKKNEKKTLKPDLLRLRLHTNPTDITQNADFDVPLYNNGAKRWHDHKDYSSMGVDVAVVEIDQEQLKKGHFIRALSAANFFPKNFRMEPGEDVMVIGFPRGVSDSKHNLPLMRNAMIASAYGVHFEGRPFFFIDSNLHPGTSGSPVLTKPKNVWPDDKGNTNLLTGSPIYFLGVHSATASYKPAGDEPLGLAFVWYASVIEQIIESIPTTSPR